jgi:hydroxyacylglutathione hydrolase
VLSATSIRAIEDFAWLDRKATRSIGAEQVLLRPFLYEDTACASYLFGCLTRSKLAVCDPHAELIDEYVAAAERAGAPIAAVFETHVHADHVSGLPGLVDATGATPYVPEGAGVQFEHVALADGDVVELGNTLVRALATPGHAPAHHAYVIADRRRGTEEPWLVFTGDSLLVGDVGRPDLHANGDARPLAYELHASLGRLLALGDEVVLYPGHYGGSVCGRALSANPFSSIGFERRHNSALRHDGANAFADAVLRDLPPAPADQAAIVAANVAGVLPTRA